MATISKELIKSEIEKVPEERLDELYEVVKNYTRGEPSANGKPLLTRLSAISIDGPEDFAENLDLYLSGEKSIG